MSLNINLNGRCALVSGVTSGIGAGIALALAQAGCDVAGCGLEQAEHPGVKRFLANARENGRAAFYKCVDLSRVDEVQPFVEWAAIQLDGFDLVVSNAGRNYFRGVENTSEADWSENISLNLASHWRLAQSAKQYLDVATQPVIVIISSNQAYRTLPECFPYNVAKSGLTALVQSLALEWGPHIRSVGIAPGFIETAQSEPWFASFPEPAAKRAQVAGIHPVGRMGTPEDVGALCAFLCSPLAGFISGVTLLVDGGRSAVMQDV